MNRYSHERKTPKKKAKALRLEHIAQVVEHFRQQPETHKRSRDLAIVLTGFFGDFHRCELVSIQIWDLAGEPEYLIFTDPTQKPIRNQQS